MNMTASITSKHQHVYRKSKHTLSASHSHFLVIFHLQSAEACWNLKLNYESLLLNENLIDVTLSQKCSHGEFHIFLNNMVLLANIVKQLI